MLRRALAGLTVGALLLSACTAANGTTAVESSTSKVKVGAVTIMSHPSLDLVYQGVKEGLASAGYVEGDNLELSFENPQGDQSTLANIVNTYAGSDRQYFVAIATPPAQALAQVVKDRPIVFASVTDPVAAGLVDSMQSPGGNVTGTSDQLPTDRQLAVIKELKPGVKTVGIVYSSGEVNAQVQAEAAIEAGKKLGLTVKTATVTNGSEVQQAAESLDVDAYFVLVDNTVVSAMESMVQVAEQHQRLLVASDADSVQRGAAAALATDYEAQGKQTGELLAKVIKGADPATTSVELQKTLEFAINPAAAKRMGVSIPDEVVKKADETF